MDFTIKNKAISIVSKRNSGKSILVKYLIKDAIREQHFNKIFVISSTNCVNHFYNDFIEPTCIFDCKIHYYYIHYLIFNIYFLIL